MKHVRIFTIILMSVFMTACSQSENKNAEEDIQESAEHISREDFEESISTLEAQGDRPEIIAQKEQAYLDYGIFLIYNADPASMRENANDALRQFIKVLNINPENEKARAEIEQILSIYRTFENREPEDSIKIELQEFGFEI